MNRRIKIARISTPFAAAAAAALVMGDGLRAEFITLAPTADATLIEAMPENSLGGASFLNAGTTQNYTRNHGLIRYDPRQKIPPGARITSVRMTLEVLQRPRDGFAALQLGLYRLLQPWGEGITLPVRPDTSPGLGGPAADGDATWTHRFFNTTNTWAEPGGAPGIDFNAAPSVAILVFSVDDSPYEFPSTPPLVADVQSWLDAPELNFGWMLRPVDEAPNFTARRYGSREGDLPPVLFVEYVDTTPRPLSLSATRLPDGARALVFQQPAGSSLRLEQSVDVALPAWTTVREFPAAAAVEERSVSLENVEPTVFYRLVRDP